ncbi:uncharacterized protein LODBEIA_P42160 [Lodderomyces beijingensis]|uniref:SAP domain-containing protein n=1 Tax=Lodderomyces beijingensis TaxID=1775926 RepID=A0ABP0ZUM2_9ASCO
MSSFGDFKKADLKLVLKKLGVHSLTKDTKKIMVEKLDNYLVKNPQGLAQVEAILEEVGASKVDEEEVTVVEEADVDDDDEEEVGEGVEVLQVVQEIEEEEDDDDEEDDEEDEEEDEEGEGEGEEGEEDDEEADPDYNAPPPLNLKETVLDPVLAKGEEAIDKIYELSDSLSISFFEYTERLRDQLSSTVTLNYFELLLEFSFYLYNFTSIVPLNKNKAIHQIFHDNLPLLANSTIPSLEIAGLLEYKAIATGLTWFVSALILPSLISYFVNFTSRVVLIGDEEFVFRYHSFDPFIFALAKILIYYLVGQSAMIEFSTGECWCSSYFNKFLMHLGLYHSFVSTLGSLPYVLGGVNVLIVLYSQFEEF